MEENLKVMNCFFGINRDTKHNESDWEFCLRCCLAKVNGDIDADWSEIVDHFHLNCHPDTLRKNFVGSMGVQHVAKYYEERALKQQVKDEPSQAIKELEHKQHELWKERQKLKDERSNLNRALRTEARWERVLEILQEAVESYEYDEYEYLMSHRYEGTKCEACLLLSDWHIGSKFETYLNSYNTDIAKERMAKLLQNSIEYCTLHKVQTLYIEILGDMISGIIHVNNRIQACENVIGSTVVATEMLSKFVYEMSKVVPQIKLVYCVGNHGRVNADIKESLNEENFEYLIKYYMEEKLKNIPNIEWLENNINKEVCFFTLANGRTIASAHGHRERRKYKDAVKEYTDYSGQYHVDEVHLGHLHNPQLIYNVVVNGSMMGCDEYAQNMKYHSVPSQVMRVYDGKGNFITYEINLGD